MVERWKIGIIGAGGISEAHLQAIREEPRAEVTAIADVSAEMAAMRAQRHGIPQIFLDYRKMLEQADPDAVIVCVPNHLHREAALQALAAGKHVLCEKPMAINTAQAEEMAEAAKRAGKILMPAHNNRFRSESRYLKKQVAEGKLGEVYHAKAGWVRRSGIPGWGSWFTRQEMAGGGPLIDIGVHMLDLVLWLVGQPKPLSVLGQTYAQFGPRKRGLSGWGRTDEGGFFDVEDMAVALIRFDNGFTLSLDASWASHIQQENAFLQLYGSEGGTSLQLLENRLAFYSEWDGALSDSQLQIKRDNERAVLFSHFIDAIEGKAAPLCTPEEAVYINRLIDAIYLSARTGTAVAWE